MLRVQSLFEEIGMIALLQKGYAPMVRLKLFAGEAEMHFRLSYEGEAYNPLENLDEISGAIVRNIAECTHRYENGTNELPLRHLKTLCLYYRVSADVILGLPKETS